MDDIVTLTMNPAVDISVSVGRLVPSHKLRCSDVRRDAGGGGINVARIVRRLGGDPLAIFPAGGPTGALLESLVRAETVRCRIVAIAGETREDFSVSAREAGDQYRFVLPGPALTGEEAQACLDALAAAAGASAFVVASGSLPPGLPDDFYLRVASVATTRGARFVLDTSGAPLKSALGRHVHLIKPSQRELAELTGEPIDDEGACVRAARRIVANGGARLVAVSRGALGAILVGKGLTLRATAPQVAAVSSIGAGDSFLGGMILALSRGGAPEEALRSAVATGSAALLSAGTGLGDAAQVESLRTKVHVSPIA